MPEIELHLRRAHTLEDYHACVDLQREVWALSSAEDMVSHIASTAILKIANEHGGSVLVAEGGGQILGFSFAMLGKQLWWSHMTAVRSEHRNESIGLRLKLRQREDALRAGIEEIHWTFDPLQAPNAHFNFKKLGVIARKYEENAYGATSSALHHGLPTDRFIAEWHLNSERVLDRTTLSRATVILRDLDRIPRTNTTHSDLRLDLNDELLLLEIPTDLHGVENLHAWQQMLRAACAHYFKSGYEVIDFFRLTQPRPQALYLLSHTSALL